MVKRIALAMFLLGVSFQISAQVDRATLVGTVTDTSGAVVPGAKLEIVSTETGLRRAVETDVADPVFDGLSITFTNPANLLANRVDRVAISGGDPVLGTRKWYYLRAVRVGAIKG